MESKYKEILLLSGLDHMTEEELKRFKFFAEDKFCIPRSELQGAGRTELADLMIKRAGAKSAVEQSIDIFRTLKYMKIAELLQNEKKKVEGKPMINTKKNTHTKKKNIDTKMKNTNIKKVTNTKKKVTDTKKKVTDTKKKVTDTKKKVTNTKKKVADTKKKVTNTKKVADTKKKVTNTKKIDTNTKKRTQNVKERSQAKNCSIASATSRDKQSAVKVSPQDKVTSLGTWPGQQAGSTSFSGGNPSVVGFPASDEILNQMFCLSRNVSVHLGVM
ncbi:interferon-inducible protein AIM2-like [Meriones unguiculatus]|uniref:interferon-inducible protein AIM2-like n=1 Tax=Meriones unguiculatus TaxID=10047 RepID=UPI00293E4850|nr:interferon-inducible protein AIM2-like [Meriones unguiculatus]